MAECAFMNRPVSRRLPKAAELPEELLMPDIAKWGYNTTKQWAQLHPHCYVESLVVVAAMAGLGLYVPVVHSTQVVRHKKAKKAPSKQ